jgi:acyl-CoA reductase-like NAD-dependent aldehyde dehydrogenase
VLHDSVFDKFQTLFVEETKKVITGDPNDEKTLVGPMISENEAVRVESWVRESLNDGATIVTGGERNGKFYAPTVLKDVRPTMKVCSEEIFGPVVTLERYSKIEEAIVKVNDSKYGLQAGMFSNDLSTVQYAYQHLNVGGLIVNDYPTFRVDNMPYGGVKDSGLGREGVRYAMDEMMEKKLLVL